MAIRQVFEFPVTDEILETDKLWHFEGDFIIIQRRLMHYRYKLPQTVKQKLIKFLQGEN